MRIIAGIIALSLLAFPARAEDAKTPAKAEALGLGISAVVNEEAVTSYDVQSRIKFIMATTKMSNTPDVLERITPQVIRSLVDEKLQLQEAKKNNVVITDKDVAGATASIETQREMPPGTIQHILESNHVPKSTFEQQIRAQLAWSKLVSKKFRSQTHVSDEEIQLTIQRMSQPSDKQELQIAIASLPVDKPSREAEVKKLADKLVKEVRGGANFEEVARQFAGGGKVEPFWIMPDQLDPVVARVLTATNPGSVTDPLRNTEGYTIIKVYHTRSIDSDKKDYEVQLKEILLKLKPDADNKESDVLLQIGEEVAKHPGTCQEKTIAGIDHLDDFAIDVDFRSALLSELPQALRVIADTLKIGDISAPFASDEGIRLYMLCGKKASNAKAVDRERVYSMLMQQKMEMQAQKYLRDLRRESFIDIRK